MCSSGLRLNTGSKHRWPHYFWLWGRAAQASRQSSGTNRNVIPPNFYFLVPWPAYTSYDPISPPPPALTSWIDAFPKSLECVSVVFIHRCMTNTSKLRGITAVAFLALLTHLCVSRCGSPHCVSPSGRDTGCHSHCDDRKAREQVDFKPVLKANPWTSHWPNQVT